MSTQYSRLPGLLFLAVLLTLAGCGPQTTKEDVSLAQSGCDSTSYCGFPCMTPASEADKQLMYYAKTEADIQNATFAAAPSTSVSFSKRTSGLKNEQDQQMDFSTNFYFYATDFDDDNSAPYLNKNLPGYLHVIAITNIVHVKPGGPWRKSEKVTDLITCDADYYQGYEYDFEMIPRIVGGKTPKSAILAPSPDAQSKTGYNSFFTTWNLKSQYGLLNILVFDGSNWAVPQSGYQPTYSLDLASKILSHYKIEAVQTDSSSGINFTMSGINDQDSDIYCSSTKFPTMFQVLNYFKFSQADLINDSLQIVFDYMIEMKATEQYYLEQEIVTNYYAYCGSLDAYGSAKNSSSSETYHTDTLQLSTWTNGDYNDPNNPSDKKIDTIQISKGFWGGN